MTLLAVFVFSASVICLSNGIGLEPIDAGYVYKPKDAPIFPAFIPKKVSEAPCYEYSYEYSEETETPDVPCLPNEEPITKQMCCESSCSSECAANRCSSFELAPARCICASGYVRHNGVCILPASCPVERCPLNSKWSPCTPSCVPICGILCEQPNNNCTGPPTCICNEGYSKLGKLCIPDRVCRIRLGRLSL